MTAQTNEDTACDIDLGGTIQQINVDANVHGTVWLNYPSAGKAHYIPAANYDGADPSSTNDAWFTYKLTDGTTGTVTIDVVPVNDAPTVANPIADQSANEDGDPVTIDIAGVFADIDSTSLTYSVESDNATLASAALDGTNLTLTFGADQNGAAEITVTADDGAGGTVTDTFTVTVAPVEDAPVLATDTQTLTLNEDTVAVVPDFGATDVDGGDITYTVASGPAAGTILVGGVAATTFTQAQLTAGLVKYQAPEVGPAGRGYVDPGTVAFLVQGEGDTTSLSATLAITVNEVNDPLVVAESVTTATLAEGGTVTLGDFGAYDEETEESLLTYTVTSSPTHGSLLVDGVAATTFTEAQLAAGLVQYVHDGSENFTDAVVFSVTDGSNVISDLTANITITPVNDNTPTSANTTLYAVEGQSVVIALMANDADLPATPASSLVFTVAAAPAHGAVLVDGVAASSFTLQQVNQNRVTYVHDGSETTSDSFTFTVSDGVNTSGLFTVSIVIAAVNDAPTAAPDAWTVVEDGAPYESMNVLANDSDPDSATLRVSQISEDGATWTTVPVGGSAAIGDVTVASDGTLTFTPPADSDTGASLYYRVADGAGGVAETTVTITVTPVNDAPTVASPISDQTVDEDDDPVAIDIAGVFADIDSAPLSYSVESSDAALVDATLDGTTLTLTFGANQNGVAEITVTADDGAGGTVSDTFTVTVNSVNDDPQILGTLAITVGEQLATTITPTELDAFDDDSSDLTFTILRADVPADSEVNGYFVVKGVEYKLSDGSWTEITFTPADIAAGLVAYQHGNDQDPADPIFNVPIALSDGLVTDADTLVIQIVNLNDPPVAGDVAVSATEDATETYAGDTLLGVASDVDTAHSVLRLVEGTFASAEGGTVTIYTDGDVQKIDYTPAADFFGTDTFTYQVTDGQDTSNVATVTVTVANVDDPVVAVDDAAGPVEVGTAAFAVDVLANDIAGNVDQSAETLIVSMVGYYDTSDVLQSISRPASGTDSLALPSGAVVTLSSTGEVTYQAPGVDTLNHGQSLEDTFVYEVEETADGTAEQYADEGQVTIAVIGVNHAPVANAGSVATDEDTAYSGAVSGSDVDGDSLTYALGTNVTNGTLTFNADGTFTYTPDANYHGLDSFTFTVSDGTLGSNEATVTITVNSINDAPTVVGADASMNEDAVLSGSLAVGEDVDGDALTYSLGEQAKNGTVVVNEDGTFTYTPNANYNGTDGFTFRVYDGELYSDPATVTITVNAVNDAPVAQDATFSGTEDTPITAAWADLASLVSDVENDTLEFVLDSQPANGTLTVDTEGITYTPDANFNGTDSFTYHVNDGTADSNVATITINIASVNDAPVAQDASYVGIEDTAVSGQLTGSDADGDALTYSLGEQATNGTVVVNADGTFTYTPNADFNGTDSFTFIVNDGTVDSDPATVNIAVAAINDAPVAEDATFSGTEDTDLPAAWADLASLVSDVENDALDFRLDTAPSHGTLTIDTEGITYTPDANFNGTDSFTYHVNDGTADSNVATITINIASVNDTPVAEDATFSGIEDTVLLATWLDLSGLASDVENDALTFVLDSEPANGRLDYVSEGIAYTPNPDFYGTDTFTYHVNDGKDDSSVATITINIAGANDAPIGDAHEMGLDIGEIGDVADNVITLHVRQGGAVTFDAADLASPGGSPWLGAAYEDADGPVSVLGATIPGLGTVTLDGSEITYDADLAGVGTTAFSYWIMDGSGSQTEVTVNVDIYADVNPPAPEDPAAPFTFSADSMDEPATVAFTAGQWNNGEGYPGLFSYEWDFNGDGLTDAIGETVAHTFADNGTYNVTLTVVEVGSTQGGGVASLPVTIDIVGPTATLTATGAAEAAEVALTISGYANPGVDTLTAGQVGWGDGEVAVLSADDLATIAAGGSLALAHAYADDAVYAIELTLTDEDGTWTAGQTEVTVTDVAPTLDVGEDATIFDGDTLTQTISITDPGVNDAAVVYVDWDGDGVYDETAGTVTGTGSLDLVRQFTDAGTYIVSVGLDTDGDAATLEVTDSFEVTVRPWVLWVDSFAWNASGFDVTFNKTLNADVLGLYDGEADVLLQRMVGGAVAENVSGSILFDAATNTLSFIATGMPLTQGAKYRATLVSSATAFVTTDGELLDGNGDDVPGGNYVTQTTIAGAETDAIYVDDLALAPGQSGSVGIRTSIDGSTSTVGFTLHYDPAMLTLPATAPTAAECGLPDGWFVIIYNHDPAAGVLTFSAVNLSGDPITSNLLVSLPASVPTTVAYGATQVLALSAAQAHINDDTLFSGADYGLHKAVVFGNADGTINDYSDGVLDGYGAATLDLYDAVLTARYGMGLETGFTAYKGIDPEVIADVDKNGAVDLWDATLIAREAMGLEDVAAIPALAVDAAYPTEGLGLDPLFDIADDLAVEAGGTISVAVTLTLEANASPLYAFDFGLTFDTTYLTFVEFTPSAALTGWIDSSNTSQAENGYINPGFWNPVSPIFAGDEPLVIDLGVVEFVVSSGVSETTTTVLDLSCHGGADTYASGNHVFTASVGSLVISPVVIAGDANRDGKVDDLDASILAANWQRSGDATWATGDFNGDGKVNDLDASILATNWQAGVGASLSQKGTDAACDAVLAESYGPSNLASDEVAWAYEASQTRRSSRSLKDVRTYEEAVDLLLATEDLG